MISVRKTQALEQTDRHAFGWVESLVLCVYCSVLLWAVPRHDAWADEAQAWLLAKTASPEAIFGHLLRYEGSPGLWHLLLIGLVKLHGTYAAMHWMAAAIGVLGVVVLLRWSPFPMAVRVLLPFTFFLQYQYAVVARSYVLFPVLAFGLCSVMRNERHRPWLFALLAALMANVSLHGALFSAAMVVLYVRRGRLRESLGPVSRRWAFGELGWASVLVLAGWLLVPATAWLPADHSFVGGVLNTQTVQRVMARESGRAEESRPAWAVEQAKLISKAQQQRRKARLEMVSSGGEGLFTRRAWEDAVDRSVDAGGADGKTKPWCEYVLDQLSQFGSLLTYPVSNSNLLALAFLGLTFAWLWQRGDMIMLLPWGAIFALCMLVRVGEYHTGMLWLALVCALWLTWPMGGDRVGLEDSSKGRTFRALEIAMCMVMAVQVGWTASAVWAEAHGSYSGEKELAEFLEPIAGVVPIAGLHYHTIGVNAYLGRDVFMNQRTAYWSWSMRKDADRYAPEVLEQRPRVLVVALYGPGPDALGNQWLPVAGHALRDRWNIMDLAEGFGYHETHRFCGGLRMRFGVAENECEVVMEPLELRASVAKPAH